MRTLSPSMVGSSGRISQGGEHAGSCTGAAKIYATTIEPNSPGRRVIGPEDWKKRSVSGLSVIDEADMGHFGVAGVALAVSLRWVQGGGEVAV